MTFLAVTDRRPHRELTNQQAFWDVGFYNPKYNLLLVVIVPQPPCGRHGVKPFFTVCVNPSTQTQLLPDFYTQYGRKQAILNMSFKFNFRDELMRKRLLLLLIVLPLWVQAGPVYKWVDEKGIVHFSSKPHHEAKDVETLKNPEAPEMPHASARKRETANKESPEAEKEVVENASPTSEQVEYCKALRNNLDTLKTSPRIRKKKDNGEFEVLGDEAREAEMDRVQKTIEEFCQ